MKAIRATKYSISSGDVAVRCREEITHEHDLIPVSSKGLNIQLIRCSTCGKHYCDLCGKALTEVIKRPATVARILSLGR